ncbi:L,D-transpeptidase family protein [Nocardia cyriacigeorgica]|uniref:L,D-transpeptidase family protein n=2 Tax=Nocardia cyriacigeorgica TaxID=135487 RepID=A0A6P1D286_9NOCA|nr:Ig-like domain-containing protein [Nocardia cyriacigeorgica]NEW38407.1 L,D-transpeptidase family protein [Nocardia cyriacigeorgica]NEW43629.1 L,D-transpeptidase family protein [Nocardia cyriacigeorgica]NEW49435.1 L,D-transpeptidase family protein [Nocardia cyriacigeorgica]NEW54161.1 L,D-transpeptidase family protein [Nocardia cyriacigeorgica]
MTARRRGAHRLRQGVLLTAAIAAAGALLVAPAQAAPHLPSGSAEMATEPVPPQANFAPPSLNPGEGEVVGVAQPIIINFKEPVGDRAAAERAIKITSSNPADGHFYWINDKQVRWRPNEFWPAETDVVVEAGGSRSAFRIGESLIATADDNTKTITVTRNGEVVKTMPTSMGKTDHETPNGTYIVGEKRREMVMDSSTYGVPIDDPEGYKLDVEYATRISYSGIFVHAAPWSVGQQGVANVSHGCLNVSTEDAKWFFENVKKGDAVVVQNTAGGTLNKGDGLGDWN